MAPEMPGNATLEDIFRKLNQLEYLLVGVKGTRENGLVGDVKELKHGLATLKLSYYLLVGVLAGSGVLVVGALGILG